MDTLLDHLAITDVGPRVVVVLETAARLTLLLLLAALAVSVLRRASASVRYQVWATALVVALTIPILVLSLPTWPIPILPVANELTTTAVADASTNLRPATQPLIPIPDVPFGPERVESVSNRKLEQVSAQAIDADAIADRRPEIEPAAPPTPVAITTTVASETLTGSIVLWLGIVWATGASAILVPLLIGVARTRWLEGRSEPLTSDPQVELVDRLRAQIGLSRRVALLRGEGAFSPLTWGVLRPAILLPIESAHWPEARLRAVLLHELAHVKRWDCLMQWVARLACAVYWFHPLVWWASYRLRVERERACDDLVLRSGSRASDYAGHLLGIAATLRPGRKPMLTAAAIPMARPSQLEGRLRAILDVGRSRRVVGRGGACLLLAFVAAVAIPLSTARLGARPAVAQVPQVEPTASVEADPTSHSETMIVSGRVLDPEGQPVPNAKVVVFAHGKALQVAAMRGTPSHVVLGSGRSDDRGRFRLEASRTSSRTYYQVQVVASAPGFGLGWSVMNPDAESPSIDLALRTEQVIEGQLVDLQGMPAPNVDLEVGSIGIILEEIGSYDGMNPWNGVPKQMDEIWPEPTRTDDDGRFRLNGIGGIGRGIDVGIQIDDPRYARQRLTIHIENEDNPKQVALPLEPAMIVEGRITSGDTGEPLGNTIVKVGSGDNSYNAFATSIFRTDDDGRYIANIRAGTYVEVQVYPPLGSPYLITARKLKGDPNVVRRQINVEVPRGVLIKGKISERGSDRPVSDAIVFYEGGRLGIVDVDEVGTIAGWMASVSAGPDGRYEIAVEPGMGRLLIYGSGGEYVHDVRGYFDHLGRRSGGERLYAHAFVPYGVAADSGSTDIDIALQPGNTLVGRVVGPEGQTVDQAEIITTLSISPFHSHWRGDYTIPVRDGRFELTGIPDDRSVKCSFLDAENGWGTTIDVDAAMAAESPVTVTLQPCGTATARIVDDQGQPLKGRLLRLHIVGTPGPGSDSSSVSLTVEERKMFRADEELYVNVDRRNYWEGPRSDAEGRITLPYLIPGATYRIYEYTPEIDKDAFRWRDFSVEAGQTLDLGDVRTRGS